MLYTKVIKMTSLKELANAVIVLLLAQQWLFKNTGISDLCSVLSWLESSAGVCSYDESLMHQQVN